jgi:hypothetical protein
MDIKDPVGFVKKVLDDYSYEYFSFELDGVTECNVGNSHVKTYCLGNIVLTHTITCAHRSHSILFQIGLSGSYGDSFVDGCKDWCFDLLDYSSKEEFRQDLIENVGFSFEQLLDPLAVEKAA